MSFQIQNDLLTIQQKGRKQSPTKGIFPCIFWPPHVTCRILVLQPGIEPKPSAVEAPCLNQWTPQGSSQH